LLFFAVCEFGESFLGIFEGVALPIDLLALSALPELIIEVIVFSILPIQALLGVLSTDFNDLSIIAFHTSRQEVALINSQIEEFEDGPELLSSLLILNEEAREILSSLKVPLISCNNDSFF
jgi:hypothetical protein